MTVGVVALFGLIASTGPAGALGPRAAAEQQARSKIALAASAVVPSAVDCVGPAGDPEPGSQAWQQRDQENQYCATERLQDEMVNPAFGAMFWSQTPGMYAAQNVAMLQQPTHPHVSLAQFVPGGQRPTRSAQSIDGRRRVEDACSRSRSRPPTVPS